MEPWACTHKAKSAAVPHKHRAQQTTTVIGKNSAPKEEAVHVEISWSRSSGRIPGSSPPGMNPGSAATLAPGDLRLRRTVTLTLESLLTTDKPLCTCADGSGLWPIACHPRNVYEEREVGCWASNYELLLHPRMSFARHETIRCCCNVDDGKSC